MAQKCNIDQIKNSLTGLQSQLDEIKESKEEIGSQSELDATIQSKKANEEKRQSSSWWGRIRETVIKGLKVKSTHASDSREGSQGGSRKSKRTSRQDQEDANLEISKLQNDIRQMKAAFDKLDHFQSDISKLLKTEVPLTKLKAILLKTDSVKSQARDLKEIRRKVLNLKGQIPSLLKKQSSIGLSITDSQTAEENNEIVETGIDILLPALHAETTGTDISIDFKHSPAFEEVVDTFEDLEFKHQLCLLSFAVFPENKEVKKTMLMYWWIGEGFIGHEDSENKVTRILDEFSRKGLLEPVEDETKVKPSGYKMDPHVHAAVVYLARFMELFDLYYKGKLKMKRPERNNVCLVKRSSLQPEAKASKMQPKGLNSIFNSSERFPDFTFKWFPEMESLKVLYLGRWERTATRHIEVESTEFLKDIKFLRNLRLASFQGISRIENLKDLTCSLPNLVILDLRACYNLEGLPKDIDSLSSLVYLDVSECYMLDRMPPEISRLERLQVLKGFVISQSDNEKDCAVKHLKNLRKLSITVNRYQFEVDSFMDSLKDLTKLESLKIAWGARFRDEDGVKRGRMEQNDKGKTRKHKDPKEGQDDQAHKKGQTSEEKNNEDGNKKDNIEEGKKHHEVNAESLKSDEVVEGDKGNADQEEGKKIKADKGKAATEEDKVDAEKSRSEDGVEGVKKGSPSSESTYTIENKKTSDKQEEKRDGEKEKVNPEEEEKKKDEVKEVTSKAEDEKTSPPQESKETVKSKPDEGDKQEEKRDGEKDNTEGEKKDELKAENSEPGKVDKKTSPPQKSKDTVTSNPDDNQRGDIQEEKKDIIEEGNKKHGVKSENSKPEKVDEKTSPAQQSKDTIHSKEDDHKENIKDGENIKTALKKPDDGGEAKTQKLEKNKLHKKVSFSEEPRAHVQKKPATKESGPRIPKLFTMTRTTTKKLGKGRQEDSIIETSKLPSSLKKLELECYPEKEPPVWLNPKTLDNLTKLSIKGGKLSRFSDEPLNAENKCGVEILRLKYLHEFKAEWKGLKALFPRLILLEKYKCPEVAFCPTDGNGVWRSQR
ncbi:Leucine-rich repeat [Hirschfeldia incana]|nr:Leucine-rich repeat [Hirschfeldia incana]